MCCVKELLWIFVVFTNNILELKKKNVLTKIGISQSILLLIFFGSLFIILHIKLLYDTSVRVWKEEEQKEGKKELTLSAICYNLEEGNDLDLIENLEAPSTFESIFFIDTSCRGELTSRQACSVEAAARAHPGKTVYVLFSAPVSKDQMESKATTRLLQFRNVKYARVYFKNYIKKTPLASVIVSKPFFNERFWTKYAHDIIRYLTFYKYGGLYLDTDVLVVKSLEVFGYDWIGKENDESASSAIMSVSKSHVGEELVRALFAELKSGYRYAQRKRDQEIIDGVLTRLCINFPAFLWNAEFCRGFQVYEQEYFYPVSKDQVYRYFNTSRLPIPLDTVYTHHFWDEVSYNMRIEKDSVYLKLAKEYCPAMFEVFGEDFGNEA